MNDNDREYSKSHVAIVVMIAAILINPAFVRAEECPREMFDRPGGFPATDYRVTVDSINFPELHQGESSSIALTSNATYLVAWQSVNADQSPDNDIYVLRERDHSGGDPGNLTECPLRLTLAGDGANHSAVSVAVGLRVPSDPPRFHFMVAWTSEILSPSQAPSLRKLNAMNFLLFPEDVFPSGHAFSVGGFVDLPIPPAGGNLDVGPSAGISDVNDAVALSNSRRTPNDRGLIYELESGASIIDRVRCCDDPIICSSENCAVQFALWQPCIAMPNDGNGRYCVVWSEKNLPGATQLFSFDIGLRLYDSLGNQLASIDRANLEPFNAVNQPRREVGDSNQLSPAVDFDHCGNIVVTWVGPSPPGASATLNVYARRLWFDDSDGSLHFLGDQFVVNVDDGWQLGVDPDRIHPSVVLTPGGALPGDEGRFLIAWNANAFAQNPDTSLLGSDAFQWGVRGQLFSPNLEAVGPNFDVSPNPTPGEFATFDGFDRTLAASAQHTIDMGPKLRKVATWTAVNADDPPASQVRDVWITTFLDTFSGASLEDFFDGQGLVCLKGDLDLDGAVTPADIPPFVALLVPLPHGRGSDGGDAFDVLSGSQSVHHEKGYSGRLQIVRFVSGGCYPPSRADGVGLFSMSMAIQSGV